MIIGINLIQYTDFQGIENFSRNIISNFQLDDGDELILFTNQNSLKLFGDLNKKAKVINKNFAKLSRANLIIYQQFGLIKKLKKEKVDILLCPSLALPIFYRKKIVVIHDLAFKRFPEESSFFSRIYLNFTLWSAKYFSLKILTISEFSRREISNIMNIPLEKIPNISQGVPYLPQVDENEIEQTIKKFKLGGKIKKYFLYIGNTHPRKNLNNLAKAFELFSQKNPEYYIVLAGKKSNEMNNIFFSSAERGKVICTGFISDKEKVALIKQACAVTFPSYYEGFGAPVLEAQSLGTPLITGNVSSLPEVAGNAAIFVNPKNIQEIEEAFVTATNNKSLIEELERNGIKNCERFSWEETTKKLYKIFKTS